MVVVVVVDLINVGFTEVVPKWLTGQKVFNKYTVHKCIGMYVYVFIHVLM